MYALFKKAFIVDIREFNRIFMWLMNLIKSKYILITINSLFGKMFKYLFEYFTQMYVQCYFHKVYENLWLILL